MIELNLSPLGSPVGVLGFRVEYSVLRWIGIYTGAGIGIGGPQLAGGIRLRLEAARWLAFSIAPGVSGGGFTRFSVSGGEKTFAWAIWLNGEISVDFRTSGGFVCRLFGGVSQMMNPGAVYGDDLCAPGGTATYHGILVETAPIAGIGLGYAF